MLQVLIVEPDAAFCGVLASVCEPHASVMTCCQFVHAHELVLGQPPDVLVTNLRLAEYNGLHLIILARTSGRSSRAILHTDLPDYLLIREAQALGAMYEPTAQLPLMLPSYLNATWPVRDRRDPRQVDRRIVYRGGRRACDAAVRAQPVLP